MNKLIIFSALVAVSQAGYIPAPYAAYPYGAYAPAPAVPYAAAPVAVAHAPVAVAPAPVTSSQYQAQDEFANFNYGYSNINSAKVEQGNGYGAVAGSYRYIDANGINQRVDYIADDAGFRITGATNLPVAPVHKAAALPVAPVFNGVPMADTPEVAAAKAEFFKAFEAAKSRAKRDITYAAAPAVAYAGLNPHFYGGYHGYSMATPLAYAAAPVQAIAYNAAPAVAVAPAPIAATYAAPAAAAVVASAPAVREAVLQKVQLNPGHAVAYRVY